MRLPAPYSQPYEQLQSALVHLEDLQGKALMDGIQQVQGFFAREILTLSVQELEPHLSSPLQSYNTEIHKQLRLLATDATFLQAARQTQTQQQRQSQLSDRLKILRGYCQAVLKE